MRDTKTLVVLIEDRHLKSKKCNEGLTKPESCIVNDPEVPDRTLPTMRSVIPDGVPQFPGNICANRPPHAVSTVNAFRREYLDVFEELRSKI